MLSIKDASARSGLPAKTIRYYEDVGLVTPERQDNGYRSFSEADVHKLAFLGRTRAFGFSIEDCRRLLALWEDESRASAEVKQLARAHLEEIDAKIAQLQGLRDTLSDLVSCCRGDNRPDCPILKDLAKPPEAAEG